MYFSEPVLLTRCHCETYIINKSYASCFLGFFLLLYALSEAASYLWRQVFSKTDINCEVEDCRLMPFSSAAVSMYHGNLFYNLLTLLLEQYH